jgi:hypothetical protein
MLDRLRLRLCQVLRVGVAIRIDREAEEARVAFVFCPILPLEAGRAFL